MTKKDKEIVIIACDVLLTKDDEQLALLCPNLSRAEIGKTRDKILSSLKYHGVSSWLREIVPLVRNIEKRGSENEEN